MFIYRLDLGAINTLAPQGGHPRPPPQPPPGWICVEMFMVAKQKVSQSWSQLVAHGHLGQIIWDTFGKII